jgi:hypothetical protein
MKWQPIETAPKDGTRILLRERWAGYPFVGYWTGRLWTGETEHLKAEGGWDGAIIVDHTTQADIFEWCPIPAWTQPGADAP